MVMPSAVHRSPLHHWHVAHGARFAEIDGWQVPIAYTDPRQEADAVRSGIGLADISPFAKLSLRGSGVPAVAVALGNIDVRRLSIHDGAIACRLTEQSVFLLASSPNKTSLIDCVSSSADILTTDVTSAHAGFALLGEHAEEVLRRLTSLDVSSPSFGEGTCAESELAGVHALLVRPPARAVPEIAAYVAWDVSEYVWESMLRAGGDLGLAPVGHDGLVALRAAP